MSAEREPEDGSRVGGGELAAKLAVTELLYRYAELIDAGDFDGVGVLLGRGSFMGVSGAEKIAKLFAGMVRRFPDFDNTPRTRHLVLNPIVDVDGDTASARSTFCVIQQTDSIALQPIAIGRYADVFGCDSTGWYFTERKVDLQMTGDVSDHLLIDPKQFE